jgi:Mn2+/Fe2+ NRAMP family transporter
MAVVGMGAADNVNLAPMAEVNSTPNSSPTAPGGSNSSRTASRRALGILKHVGLWLAIVGPGLMIMLADTDAGSLITAAQSGAQWRYAMVLPLLLLIPFLYVVQEMTVRLGCVTQRGHGELIRSHFGLGWALISVITLFVACLGALVTEFVAISGAAELFHIPPWFSVPFVSVVLVAIGLTGSYRRVERIGIAMGLLELLFIPAALLARPDWGEMTRSLANLPIDQGGFLFLLAANVGAVIMPWMVFYQQGAVVDKKLRKEDLKAARLDTLIGAVVTQLIMISVVVALSASVSASSPSPSFTAASTGPGVSEGALGAGSVLNLNTIKDISELLQPALGSSLAVVLAGLGMIGAGFLAALVVSLAGAWGIGEAFGVAHSLNVPFRKAKAFYTIYTAAHLGGALVVLSGLPLISLTIDIEVMNAILLPIVLGFLLALEQVALPARYRMKGLYKGVTWIMACAVMLFGIYIAGGVLLQAFSS